MQWASTLSRDFFLANVFVWFHKNFSINFYNVSKSKKWPKIRKFRGFGPLKIEPMELRTRKKTFGASFILEQLVSMRVQKIFFSKALFILKFSDKMVSNERQGYDSETIFISSVSKSMGAFRLKVSSSEVTGSVCGDWFFQV